MISRAKFFIFSILILLFSTTLSHAVVIDAKTGVFESGLEEENGYTELGQEVKKIENYLKSGQANADDLNHYIKVMIDMKSKLLDFKKNISKDIGFVQQRIQALGDEPAESEYVVETIAKKRQTFNEEASFHRARLVEVEVLLAKINELDSVIMNTKNKELMGRLLDKQSPLIYPTNLFFATKAFIGFIIDIIQSPVVWYKSLNYDQTVYVNSNILPVILIVGLCFLLGLYVRLFILKRLGYNKKIENPKYIRKVGAAASVAIAYGAIPAMMFGGFLLWMQNSEVMTIGFFGLVVTTSLQYFLYIFLSMATARVIFAPYHGKWRLANVSDEKAKRIKVALYMSIAAIGMLTLLEDISIKSNYPIELISFISVVAGAIKVFSFLVVSKRIFWDDAIFNTNYNVNDSIFEEDDFYYEDEPSKFSRIALFLSVFSVLFFAISLFGYPSLSAYLLNRFLASFVLVGLFIIVRKAILEVIHRILLLMFWTRHFKLRRKMISKIDFWLALFFDTLLIVVISVIVLSIWGVPRALLFDWAKKLFLGFSIGGVEISLIAIIFGIAIFIISITLVRVLKGKLMTNILEKMDIEEGIRHSLASGFGFVGFVLAIIISILVMGGNLTNLALIAGALSFGIGLGLQNIVNNFVSGIILLFERPVKVGDWVVVNNYEGIIKQVNIRATELQLWNRSVVVIPNADFLSTSVVNYTLHDRLGRIELAVSVAYGTDVKKVEEILVEIGKKHKQVLKNPEPYVVFMNFGNTSLDFQLRCFTKDIMSRLSISSALRYEINQRFVDEGIRLAIPQVLYRSFNEDNFDANTGNPIPMSR